MNPFHLTAPQIAAQLHRGRADLPELERLAAAPHLARFLAASAAAVAERRPPPVTGYTAYRRFVIDGDRAEYERPYFEKRRVLAGLAVRALLGDDVRAQLHDYLWSVCEESSWVLPAHEARDPIDLFAAETGFMVAELLELLGDRIDVEVRSRMRRELEQRIFGPYLRLHRIAWWHRAGMNWNGVCNASVASAFVLAEPEPQRVAQALAIAFTGLDVFLDTAFETDGGSNEGVAYWHYGLFNVVALAELVHQRTAGAIDLLADERLQRIAAYPVAMHLSGARFVSFSDCDETLQLHPGMVSRLAARTGVAALRGIINQQNLAVDDWRVTMLLRDLVWWDGALPPAGVPADAFLPACGIARLVAHLADGTPVIAAIKAGHNAENHNQNDVGSFLVHLAGENLLADPGRGLYTRQYFGPERYQNVFANSYGHSVPRIDGRQQQPGREHAGSISAIQRTAEQAQVTVELAAAYGVPALVRLMRLLRLDAAGSLVLEDTIEGDVEVEEAFITWSDVELAGARARIDGAAAALDLCIREPAGATFALELLEAESRANGKDVVLKRLSVALPAGTQRFVCDVVPRRTAP